MIIDVTDDCLRPDDRTRLAAIIDADGWGCAELIYAYWHDADRADRTPRKYFYLHLGLITGMYRTALDELDRRPEE